MSIDAAVDRGFDDLELDETLTVEHEVTAAALDAFAAVSGDHSPIHMDDGAARAAKLERRVAHGVLLVAWTSEIVGMRLPGRRSLLVDLQFDFKKPVYVGDTVTLEARVAGLSEAARHVTLALTARVGEIRVAKGRVGVVVR